VTDDRMPADPEPDAASRILYEWLTEIARAVAVAERVDPGVGTVDDFSPAVTKVLVRTVSRRCPRGDHVPGCGLLLSLFRG
jgi:hypothetical protein